LFPHDKVFALPQAAFSILILAYFELKTPLPAFSTQSVSEEDTFGNENHVCSGSRRRKKYLHQAILFENGNVENLHPEQPLSLKMQVELRCQSTCLNCGLHASSPASRHTSANEGCRALQPCPIPPLLHHIWRCTARPTSPRLLPISVHSQGHDYSCSEMEVFSSAGPLFSQPPPSGRAWPGGLPTAWKSRAGHAMPCYALLASCHHPARESLHNRICLLTGNRHAACRPLTRAAHRR
jgi:hypothetical protein